MQLLLKIKFIKKWRSIAIFGHFAKAIVRKNGYKMVAFLEVVINQPRWLFRPQVQETGTSKWRDTVMYSLDPTQFISFPRNQYGKN